MKKTYKEPDIQFMFPESHTPISAGWDDWDDWEEDESGETDSDTTEYNSSFNADFEESESGDNWMNLFW